MANVAPGSAIGAEALVNTFPSSGSNVSDVSTRATEMFDRATSSAFTTENHIWIYTAPLILALAVVGNLLTIVVKLRTRSGASTHWYFALLALGDMLVVVIGLVPEWLGQMGIVEIWNLSPWVCRVELYLYYTALDFAIWMLVAFTCDRVVAVLLPLRKRRLCTARNALLVALAVFVVANVNAHVFWTRGAQYGDNGELIGNCRYLDPYYHFEANIRPWLVLVFALIGPFLAIGLSNLLILITVLRAKNVRKLSASGSMRNARTAQRMSKHLGQTTIMCMVTSVVFMILVLPNIVLLIGKSAWSKDNPTYWLCRAVAGQLVYINHSINFLLYAVAGSRFRKELAILCDPSGRLMKKDSSFASRSRHTRSTSVDTGGSSVFDKSQSMTWKTNYSKNKDLPVISSPEIRQNVAFFVDGQDDKDIHL